MELFEEFLRDEGPSVGRRTLETVQADHTDSSRQFRELNFNLFDVGINYASGTVSIEEVCSPCREQVVALATFLTALEPYRNRA